MRSEHGQASVEWIGIVLLVALALAALSHFAPRANGREAGTTLLHAMTCAAREHCAAEPGRRASSRPAFSRPAPSRPAPSRPLPARPAPARRAPSVRGSFAIPPLMPRPGQVPPPGPGPPRGPGPPSRLRVRLPALPRLPRLPELPPGALARTRRGAGLAWRRAWLGCIAYERFRYAFLHPESRIPGYAIPPREALRMANDCISPVDLVRDWPLVTGGGEGGPGGGEGGPGG
jgi:hypothetical protein